MASRRTTSAAGTQRHRKVLRDNIQGITKPVLLRIAHRAGALRVSGIVYEELRGITKVYLEEVLSKTLAYTRHRRRKTVNYDDVVNAARTLKRPLISGLDVICTRLEVRKKKSKEEEGAQGQSRSHRFRAGTVALREIRRAQKSDCLLIPRLALSRLVREISQDISEDIRYSSHALNAIQLYLESRLVEVLTNSVLTTIHASRRTVQPKDIQLARRVMGDRA